MCLRNLQKIWCMGTLIEAEILTSLLPNVFTPPCFWVLVAWHVFTKMYSQLGLDYLGTSTQLMGVSTPLKWSTNVYLCVSGTYKPNLVHGALMEAEILTSLPLAMYLFILARYLGTGTLPTGVSTPLKWSRNVSMCLRNLQKVFGA